MILYISKLIQEIVISGHNHFGRTREASAFNYKKIWFLKPIVDILPKKFLMT